MSRHPLDNIRVAKPCPVSWDSMSGDDRVRFCGACKLNVYNLSEMTRRDVTELLQLVEGRLCVRFYRRKDGTVLTKDCPGGMSWTGALARVASFLIAGSAPFWGALTVIHWREIQAAITGWVGPTPSRAGRADEIVGATIPAIERPPLGTFERPRIPRTEDELDDTPPSRAPREAR